MITAKNCLDGWKQASSIILNQGAQENLFIKFTTPCDFLDLNRWLLDRNPQDFGGDSIRKVANTIFPHRLYDLSASRQAFYDKYRQMYLKSNDRSWGTYFQRLISFDRHFQNNNINQLENAITALLGKSPQRHYIVFHLSSPNIESNVRPMGAPCWHFGEITVNPDRSINLTAVYRNHDYFNKALGNFIGLAKLLEFIGRETQRPTADLVIHSIHAFNGSTRKNLASLTN